MEKEEKENKGAVVAIIVVITLVVLGIIAGIISWYFLAGPGSEPSPTGPSGPSGPSGSTGSTGPSGPSGPIGEGLYIKSVRLNAASGQSLKITEIQVIQYGGGNVASQGTATQSSTYEPLYFPGKYSANNAIDGSNQTFSQTLVGGQWTLTFATPVYTQQVNFSGDSVGAFITIITPDFELPSLKIEYTEETFAWIDNPSPLNSSPACNDNKVVNNGQCVIPYEYPRFMINCSYQDTIAGNGDQFCVDDYGSSWAWTGLIEDVFECNGVGRPYKGVCYLKNFEWQNPKIFPGPIFTLRTLVTQLSVTTKDGFEIPTEDAELRVVNPDAEPNAAILQFQYNNGYLQHVQSGLFVNLVTQTTYCDSPKNSLFTLNNPIKNTTAIRIQWTNQQAGECYLYTDFGCNPEVIQYINLDKRNYLFSGPNPEIVWKINFIIE